jgi:phosphate transport system substrate-binding protein
MIKAPVRIALSVLALCSVSVAAQAEETVTIPGTGSSQLILRDAAAGFMKANPGIKVVIPDSSGTGGGYKAVGEGAAPLGRVSRRPNEKEAGYNLTYLQFGKTPVVIATHPGVKVKSLTWAQARDLVTGKVANWSEVGGPDQKVRVIARAPNEANFSAIKKNVPEWKDLVITEKSKMANTDGETVQFIAENEGALGIITLSDAKEKGLNIPIMGGVKYSDAGYPVFVDMALVHKGTLDGAAKKFADFLFSAEGQRVMKDNDAIPVSR